MLFASFVTFSSPGSLFSINQEMNQENQENQEMRLIFELGTLKPNGLNINFSLIWTCMMLLMRTHVTHPLTYTFLFHSCVSRARTFTVRFFVWRMPSCHNGLFYTDEGLCPKRLYIFNVHWHFLEFFINFSLLCLPCDQERQKRESLGTTFCLSLHTMAICTKSPCWVVCLEISHNRGISFFGVFKSDCFRSFHGVLLQ